jgi:hypothetical protein
MTFVCPNIYCGRTFESARAVSNHTRSRKCKGAKAEAEASAKRRLESEKELANLRPQSTDKRRRLENEQELEEGPHNQPEHIHIPEVTISFPVQSILKLFIFLFRGPQRLKQGLLEDQIVALDCRNDTLTTSPLSRLSQSQTLLQIPQFVN